MTDMDFVQVEKSPKASGSRASRWSARSSAPRQFCTMRTGRSRGSTSRATRTRLGGAQGPDAGDSGTRPTRPSRHATASASGLHQRRRDADVGHMVLDATTANDRGRRHAAHAGEVEKGAFAWQGTGGADRGPGPVPAGGDRSAVRGRRSRSRSDGRDGRQTGPVRLRPDRGLRAHLPQREALHLAVPRRRGEGAGRHRPLPRVQAGGPAVPVRLA